MRGWVFKEFLLMIFYMTVEVDDFKSRYSEDAVIEAACDGAINELCKMKVKASVSVHPDWVNTGIKS